MDKLLKYIGIVSLIILFYSLIQKLDGVYQEYLVYTLAGVGTFAILILVFRIIFGKKWKTILVKKAFIGEDLIQAFEDTLNEIPMVSNNTKARLAGNLVFRFTRIGIIAILIASIPIILLYKQNIKIDNQNGLIELQNDLMVSQNDLITNQNYRLSQQTYLLEADRRGALVHLFSNVLDAIDNELKSSIERELSPQLIGRIISLSKALKPYSYLENDTIITNPISPERGQLLTALLASEIHSLSLERIFRGGNFNYADLEDVDVGNIRLNGLDLKFANLKNAHFNGTIFYYCSFKNASLEKVRFHHCIMKKSTFNNCNLKDASFWNSNFKETNMVNSDLTSADFYRATFNFIDFYRSNLDQVIVNSDFLKQLKNERYMRGYSNSDILDKYELKPHLNTSKYLDLDSIYFTLSLKGLDPQTKL